MYLRSQIITYMGNKRKLMAPLQEAIAIVKSELKQEYLTLGDGFSGSGVVSRLMKENAKALYVNDMAKYSCTLSECYLANPSATDLETVAKLIEEANRFADSKDNSIEVTPWIQLHWAPADDSNISQSERAFFTHNNGVRLDRYRHFIKTQVPRACRPFLLAPLLVQASIHNNTNGHFASFYKMGDKGHFGGKKEIDLHRIMASIGVELPVFSQNLCPVEVSCMDTNEWIAKVPSLDLVYYDPPYNKHPYSAYYFLLGIINDLDVSASIPDTTRGQPKDWQRSDYNSTRKAKEGFAALIKNTKAKYILVSYNSAGIISLEDMERILCKKGTIRRMNIEHKTYNRMKGIANYKRKKEDVKIKEYLWLVDCRKNMGQ